nr:polysaccharide deacetylase family protein [Collinsella urealyticum]
MRKAPGGVLPRATARRQRKPGAMYLRRSQGFGKRSGRGRLGRRNDRRPYAFIAVGCAFLVFLASILWYANRSVKITLNDAEVSVPIHAGIERLIQDRKLELKPGRLLAVDDSVMSKDGGEPYAVSLDKKKLDAKEIAELKIEGGEKLTIKNGEDTYEAHQVRATEIPPQISLKGTGPIQTVKTWGIAGRSEVWVGEQSGLTVDKGVVQEPVNCVISARGVSPANGKKLVALTFDKGPSASTEAIVKLLKEEDAKASFFLIGDKVSSHVAAVGAIAEGGNEIGVNGATGDDLTKLSGDDLRSSLSRSFDAVKAAGGGETALVRPPLSRFDLREWSETMDLVGSVVTWSVDSGDWMLPGADRIADTVVKTVNTGNIVVLSDTDATGKQTLEALPQIIRRLKDEGYELVTLSELIASDPDMAKEVSLKRQTPPKGWVLPQVPAPAESQKDES